MGRLSIELPEHQHKKIKALAAWHGLSLKNFIIQRTLSASAENEEDAVMKELMGFLTPRIESAKKGELSKLSMDAIIAKAKTKRRF